MKARRNVGASLSVELKKLYGRPATWITVSVFVPIVVVVYLSRYFLVPRVGPSAQVERYLGILYPENLVVNVLEQFDGGLGAALALTFGAISIGSEYRWHTLKFVLTQGPGRLSFLGGKFLAVGVVLAIVTLIALATSAVSSYVVAALQDGPAEWPLAGEILKGFVAGWLILVTFAALGLFLAVLFEGSTLAVVCGLLYVLVVQDLFLTLTSFESEAVARVGRVLPGRNAGDLASSFGGSQQTAQTSGLAPAMEPVAPSQATLVLIAYAVVFVVAAMLLFRRRDVA